MTTPPFDPESSTPTSPWRRRVHEVIFGADTPAGLAFDVILLVSVLASVLVVILASVAEFQRDWGHVLYAVEWFFTILFTIEYILRLASVAKPLRYATSFFGIIDLVSIIPTYASVLAPGAESFLVLRILRMLRVFRVFKLVHYVVESEVLWQAMKRSQRKITVFMATVVTIVVVVGSTMFVIEGPEHGFTSIPVAMYWAVVTLTTVGYGDISPATPAGRLLASTVMILGYAIIAVPTGIVTAELTRGPGLANRTACPGCGLAGHDDNAAYCKYCGTALPPKSDAS